MVIPFKTYVKKQKTKKHAIELKNIYILKCRIKYIFYTNIYIYVCNRVQVTHTQNPTIFQLQFKAINSYSNISH